MSDSTGALGGSFLRLILWRGGRNLLYRFVGMWRPGWRQAIPLLRLLERYSDSGTMNIPLYSDPRFDTNIRALEMELRRVRRGGTPRLVTLPHDFPPGAQELVSSYLSQ